MGTVICGPPNISAVGGADVKAEALFHVVEEGRDTVMPIGVQSFLEGQWVVYKMFFVILSRDTTLGSSAKLELIILKVWRESLFCKRLYHRHDRGHYGQSQSSAGARRSFWCA